MPDSLTTITGNVTRDPEMKYTSSGQARAVIGVAVNRRWQNRQTNEWEEQVSFFNVVCWRELAENVAESLHKGDRVVVVGRLEQRSYTPEGSDEKRSVVEIVADEVSVSLRFATASPVRNERKDSQQAPQGRPAASSSNRDPFQDTSSAQYDDSIPF